MEPLPLILDVGVGFIGRPLELGGIKYFLRACYLVALLCCNIKLSFIEIQLHELISLGYLAHRQMACDRYGCRRPHVSRAVLLSWL